MTTIDEFVPATISDRRAPVVRRARPAPQRIPLGRLVRVELRKMFDTRSGFWMLASIAITAVFATVGVVLFAPHSELTYSTFALAIRIPMAIILPMIAILSVTSEWSQRSGLTTFTLVPHRGRVLLAKGVAAVAVGVASMVLAFAIGALGNLAGTTVAGTEPVWDAALIDVAHGFLGNVLSLLIGFMLGVLIRSSSGAIVAYFVYSLVLPGVFALLASTQSWFRDLQPWVDVQFAQTPLFEYGGSLSGGQWAQIGVTGVVWMVIPMIIGVHLVLRSEVK